MGESADLIMEGVLCEMCGALIDGEETGYPRDCEDCLWDLEIIKAHRANDEQ